MSKMHYMPMFWSDFFADTESVTDDAAKAYLFLLGHAWLRGAKLPNDDRILARLARCTSKKWSGIKSEIMPFFALGADGQLTQKRLLKEWENVSSKVEKNRANGSLGGQRKVANAKANATATILDLIPGGKRFSEKPHAERKELTAQNPNENNETAVANATETLKQSKAKAIAKEDTIQSSSSSNGPDVFAKVDAALRALDLTGHPIAADPVIGHIVTLVEKGYDLHTHILPSIRRQLANANGRAISRWSYFVKGIIEDNTSEASNAPPPKDLELWTRRLKWARENRQWAYSWGPPPNFAACKAPKSLLLPEDGVGWGEWRAAE
jgi:uncharacterized protein YdaU (DUF1376 family)